MTTHLHPKDHETLLLQELNLRAALSFHALAGALSRHLRHTAQLSDSFAFMAEMSRRLEAMASFHSLLGACRSPITVLENRCREICLALVHAFGREEVAPWLRMEDFPLSHTQEQLIALLVGELMIEVIRCAPIGHETTVWIDLARVSATELQLTVQDTILDAGDPGAETSLAPELASSLGGVFRRSRSGGCRALVRFPEVLVLPPVLDAQDSRRPARILTTMQAFEDHLSKSAQYRPTA